MGGAKEAFGIQLQYHEKSTFSIFFPLVPQTQLFRRKAGNLLFVFVQLKRCGTEWMLELNYWDNDVLPGLSLGIKAFSTPMFTLSLIDIVIWHTGRHTNAKPNASIVTVCPQVHTSAFLPPIVRYISKPHCILHCEHEQSEELLIE